MISAAIMSFRSGCLCTSGTVNCKEKDLDASPYGGCGGQVRLQVCFLCKDILWVLVSFVSLCKMSSAEITYVYHTYEVLCMRTAVVEKSYLHVCTLDVIS